LTLEWVPVASLASTRMNVSVLAWVPVTDRVTVVASTGMPATPATWRSRRTPSAKVPFQPPRGVRESTRRAGVISWNRLPASSRP
jgi:hypothetical protein